jgi:conjugative transfer signal peptidase TraF
MAMTRSRRARRRLTGAVVLLAAVATAAAMHDATPTGFLVNVTPSAPLGLWKVLPLTRPVRAGDTVVFCPPPTPLFLEARGRGYLRRGLCPSQIAPLIKTIAAVGGQITTIGEDVRVDGVRLRSSRVYQTDGSNRPLSAAKGGLVPEGHVFLYSSFERSWDSRYFGPVPLGALVGFAQEALTYAP